MTRTLAWYWWVGNLKFLGIHFLSQAVFEVPCEAAALSVGETIAVRVVRVCTVRRRIIAESQVLLPSFVRTVTPVL